MFVLTADQRRSRGRPDLVPAGLEMLTHLPPPLRRAERTTGDEIQAVFDSPLSVAHATIALVGTGDWRVGIGVGSVEQPLPRSVRAARGAAFIAAREAVGAAHSNGHQLAVVPSPDAAADEPAHARLAETALWLVARVLRSRTEPGREVVGLLGSGLTQRQIARRLEVTEAAISQRVRRAGWAEQQRGVELASYHLARADGIPADRPSRSEPTPRSSASRVPGPGSHR